MNPKSVLDVRPLECRDRHALGFRTFGELGPGESFQLVNDHDPKPLYYQLQGQNPGLVEWDYAEAGPEVWRVNVGRRADVKDADQAVKAVVDVRTVVPRERHPLIFRTFDSLQPGEAFQLVNDHDPKPLHYQFQHERPGAFQWTYVEQGPQVWRVNVARS